MQLYNTRHCTANGSWRWRHWTCADLEGGGVSDPLEKLKIYSNSHSKILENRPQTPWKTRLAPWAPPPENISDSRMLDLMTLGSSPFCVYFKIFVIIITVGKLLYSDSGLQWIPGKRRAGYGTAKVEPS